MHLDIPYHRVVALACFAVSLLLAATNSRAADTADELLFDGKSLKGWKVTDFAGHGEVSIQDGALQIAMGAGLSGVNYTNPTPKVNYDVSLKARKIAGGDFFCGLTVPVRDSHCTLIVGGWGGGLVGISSIDGLDASENETMKVFYFETGKWFDIRFRVTAGRLTAWIDNEVVADVEIKDRRVSMRPGEIEVAAPFGISTYATTAQIKEVRLKKLPAEAGATAAGVPASPKAD